MIINNTYYDETIVHTLLLNINMIIYNNYVMIDHTMQHDIEAIPYHNIC